MVLIHFFGLKHCTAKENLFKHWITIYLGTVVVNSAVTSQMSKNPQQCPTRRIYISPPLHITAMKTTFLVGCEPVKVCPLRPDRTLHPRRTTGDIFNQRVYSKREVGLPECAFSIYSSPDPFEFYISPWARFRSFTQISTFNNTDAGSSLTASIAHSLRASLLWSAGSKSKSSCAVAEYLGLTSSAHALTNAL